MYNQCLGCGEVFEGDSSVLVEGCTDCGGRKFSYTGTPIPREELLEILQISNDDLGLFMEKLHDRRLSLQELDENERSLLGPDMHGWVKVDLSASPEPLPEINVTRFNNAEWEKNFLSKTADSTPTPSTPENKKRAPTGKSKGRKVNLEGERKLKKSQEKEQGIGKEQKKSSGKGKKRVCRKKRSIGSIETITETEDGVYRIDLARMMKNIQDDIPIVRMKKGVYLINLENRPGHRMERTQ